MECSICLNHVYTDSDDYTTLDCGHTFHTRCINMWLNNNNTCPNCRSIVLTSFKCKYTPYPFLPFLMRKDCVLQIKEDSIQKALLEYNICNQEKIARQKYLIKKNNEDIFILK